MRLPGRSAGFAGGFHKTAECNVCMVGDVEQEAGVDAVNSLREEFWIVGGVMEVPRGWCERKGEAHAGGTVVSVKISTEGEVEETDGEVAG